MAQETIYKKIQQTQVKYKYTCKSLKNREVHVTLEPVNIHKNIQHPCNLFEHMLIKEIKNTMYIWNHQPKHCCGAKPRTLGNSRRAGKRMNWYGLNVHLFDSSEMQTTAGAQHEFSQICKKMKAYWKHVYTPLKCFLNKKVGQGGLRKKRGVRVSHVHKPPTLQKNVFPQPGLSHSLEL